MQQSIYDTQKKWISADSNINMFAGIVSSILELRPNWKFCVLIGVPFKDIENPNQILNHKNVGYIKNDYPVSSVLSRYHFDANKAAKLLDSIRPDVIWNNIPSITRNWRAVMSELESSLCLRPLLINCNYWIDTKTEPKVADDRVAYGLRQIDGALAADLVPFTCESTKEIFLREVFFESGLSNQRRVRGNSTIWDFGFSTKEMDKYFVGRRFKKITIIFPNRLSRINYTHHKEFIEAVNSLYKERKDFQVIFTNPSHKISWQWLHENVASLKIIANHILNRKEYVELLWKSDIVVSLYDKERYGGCANVEAIYCDCLPVMTRYGEYETRASKSYPFFVELPLTANKIKDKLNDAIDFVKSCKIQIKDWTIIESDLKQRIKKSSYEQVVPIVIEDIERGYQHVCDR